MKCPNKADQNWKDLVEKIGVYKAFVEYVANDHEVPDASNYDQLAKPKEGIKSERAEAFIKDALDGVDYFFWSIAFNDKNKFTPDTIFENPLAPKRIYDAVYKILVQKRKEAGVNEDWEGVENFEFMLDNFYTKNGIVDEHLKRVRALGISLVKSTNEKTQEKEPNQVQDEDADVTTEKSHHFDENKYDRSAEAYLEAHSISTKDTMFKQVKLFIATLPKLDKQGNPEINDLGLPKLVEFNETYNFLLRNLEGALDFPEMIERMIMLQDLRPELKGLVERLKEASDTLTFDQIKFQNQFRQDFDKNLAKSYKTILKPDGTIYVVDSGREATSGRIREAWKNQLPRLFPINKNGRIIANPKDLDIKKPFEFLKKIGITLSNETIEAMAEDQGFTNAILGVYKYIQSTGFDLTDLYAKGDLEVEHTAKGNLATIVDTEAKYNANATELSHISSEGKTQYSMSLHNELSLTKHYINKAKSLQELYTYLPHLDSISTRNSLWLKEMFDEETGLRVPGTEVTLDLFDGMATQDIIDKDQKLTTKLSKGDKLVQDLNNLIVNGKTAYIRAADKATEHAISLNKYSNGDRLAVPIKTLHKSVESEELFKIFHGYFKDELQGIYELAINGIGSDVAEYRKIVKWTYDSKGKAIKADIEWRIFKNFPMSKSFKNTVEAKLIELKNDTVRTSDQKQAAIDELSASLYPQIKTSTRQFFEDYTTEVIDLFGTVGITEENKKGITTEIIDQVYDKDTVDGKEVEVAYNFKQLMRAYAINDYINSVEQSKLFLGDLAFYKDLFKRTSGATGTKKSCRVDSFLNSWMNKNYDRKDKKEADGKINVLVYEDSHQKSNYFKEYLNALIESGLSPEKADELLNAYKGMDEGDAQGWITLDEYREFFTRTGDWTTSHQAIFDKAQRGEALTDEEMFYFMPIKAQYFGPSKRAPKKGEEPKAHTGLFVPAYHKYSLMPLLPSVIKGTNLEKLNQNMIDNEVGYALFKSGSKVGTIVDENGHANRFYTEDGKDEKGNILPGIHGEINSENLVIQEVDYRFLGIQLNIDPKVKEEVVFGTQFRKLIFSNLFVNGGEIEGNNLSKEAKALFDNYSNAIKELVEIEKKRLFKDLGIKEIKEGSKTTYKHTDLSKLVDLIKKESEDRNLADNIVDFLQTQVIEGETILKYKLDLSPNKEKISSLIMSIINTRLVRQMMNGDAMVQGAGTGFEKAGRRVEGSNDLKFYRKDPKTGKTLPMEVMVPMTGQYKELLKQYGDLDKLNLAIKEGRVHENFLKLIGYRIPTQGLNSIENIRIAGFIPEESGNVVILPTEIVAKSGGDFDIDKLNIFRPHFNPETKTQKLQNELLKVAEKVLVHPDNFVSLITPNSTKILTDIVDKVLYEEYVNKKLQSNKKNKAKGLPEDRIQSFEEYSKKSKKDIDYTSQLKITTKVDQFSKFLGGKDGVGIGAIHNTHHIISQVSNLYLNRSYNVRNDDGTMEVHWANIWFDHNITPKGDIDLSALKDKNGEHLISEVISQVINASVDVAKNPFMFDLNMDKNTLGTYLYLIRTGVPVETVAFFMKQPVISEYLKESENRRSMFSKATRPANSEEGKDAAIIADITKKYKDIIARETGIEDQADLEKYINTIDYKKYTASTMKGFLNENSHGTMAFAVAQLQLLNNYIEYKQQAQLLSDAVQSVNHDTAGVGQNLNASRTKLEERAKVIETNFVGNMDNVYNTFIGAFDFHALSLGVYGDLNAAQAQVIVENNRYLLDALTSKYTSKVDRNKLLTLIENDLINYITQNYGYEQDINELFDELFEGENSVAKQILDIKTYELPEGDLTEEEEVIEKLQKNILIKELFPLLKDQQHPSTDNVKIFTKRFDTFTSNQLTNSFKEINELNPGLGKALMDLGIIQSGLNNSPITFMGIVPFDYYGDLTTAAFERFFAEKGPQNLYIFNQLFVRNNYKNSIIFHTARHMKLDDFEEKDPIEVMLLMNQGLPTKRDNGLGNGMFGKQYSRTFYNGNLRELRYANIAAEERKALADPDELVAQRNEIGDPGLPDHTSDMVENTSTTTSPATLKDNKKHDIEDLEDSKESGNIEGPKPIPNRGVPGPRRIKEKTLKDLLKESDHITQTHGDLFIKKHSYAEGIKFINEMKKKYPGQIEIERAKTTTGKDGNAIFKVKVKDLVIEGVQIAEEIVENKTEELYDFSKHGTSFNEMSEAISTKRKMGDISKKQEAELLDELASVNDAESYGKILNKICFL